MLNTHEIVFPLSTFPLSDCTENTSTSRVLCIITYKVDFIRSGKEKRNLRFFNLNRWFIVVFILYSFICIKLPWRCDVTEYYFLFYLFMFFEGLPRSREFKCSFLFFSTDYFVLWMHFSCASRAFIYIRIVSTVGLQHSSKNIPDCLSLTSFKLLVRSTLVPFWFKALEVTNMELCVHPCQPFLNNKLHDNPMLHN